MLVRRAKDELVVRRAGVMRMKNVPVNYVPNGAAGKYIARKLLSALVVLCLGNNWTKLPIFCRMECALGLNSWGGWEKQ